MTKANAVHSTAIDQFVLSERLRRFGITLEHRAGNYRLLRGNQVLLARGPGGEPVTLQQIADVTARLDV